MIDLCEKSRFNSILENIIKFLQYDVLNLFRATTSNAICQTSRTISSEEHEKLSTAIEYGCSPNIYNGDEEMPELTEYAWSDEKNTMATECIFSRHNSPTNSQDLLENDIINIDFSSSEDEEELDETFISCPQQPVQNGRSTKSKLSNCPNTSLSCSSNNICHQIHHEIQQTYSSSSAEELATIEERSQKLYEYINKDIGSCSGNSFPNWWNLKSWQKLPFYWAALSNEILSKDPFENFKRFYLSNIPYGKRNTKKANEKVLIVWHSLAHEQKVPFVMEAFIAKIGTGRVNMGDEQEIRMVMEILKNKCG